MPKGTLAQSEWAVNIKRARWPELLIALRRSLDDPTKAQARADQVTQAGYPVEIAELRKLCENQVFKEELDLAPARFWIDGRNDDPDQLVADIEPTIRSWLELFKTPRAWRDFLLGRNVRVPYELLQVVDSAACQDPVKPARDPRNRAWDSFRF